MDKEDRCLEGTSKSDCELIFKNETIKLFTILGMIVFVLTISYIKCMSVFDFRFNLKFQVKCRGRSDDDEEQPRNQRMAMG